MKGTSADDVDEFPETTGHPNRRGVKLVGKTLWLGGLTIVLLVLLVVTVFPTRAYLDQREAVAGASADIDTVRIEIQTLENRIDDFNDRASVARIARERFSLVFEGEELFRLSVRPSASVELPRAWMWPGFERILRGP